MHALRQAFDIERPFVVAVESLPFAGKSYMRGDVFPWRELGLDGDALFQLWTTLKVDAQPIAQSEPAGVSRPRPLHAKQKHGAQRK